MVRCIVCELKGSMQLDVHVSSVGIGVASRQNTTIDKLHMSETCFSIPYLGKDWSTLLIVSRLQR